MHMEHKNYMQCSHHIWLEDVCKVLRHDSYCKWAIEATMVWHTPPNYLLANCDQFTTCNCESILTLNVFFKHENCSHTSVESAPKVSGHAFIS
jgi:hypothetical protein